MAQPLTATDARENGQLAEGPPAAKEDVSTQNSVASLRTMLSTAEFWDESKDSLPAPAPEVNVAQEAPSAESELELLRRENTDLRALVLDLQRRLEVGGAGGDSGWEARQREYDSLLEEKSEVIRALHQKIQELQARAPSPPLTPKEGELIALSDELERERCQLEQDRRQLEDERAQLKEDEKMMMQQMRDMEMSMARERAELARQRNELQRLHTEVHHELELASRDAALRERLMPLQRRHQEMSQRRAGDSPREQPPQAPAADNAVKENGLLRRLFG